MLLHARLRPRPGQRVVRLMSVAHTEQAVIEQLKDVTRRLGWWTDKNGRRLLLPGDRLQLCRKVMGRRDGEPLVRLAVVEVVDVRRERLNEITEDDIDREGVEPHVYLPASLVAAPRKYWWISWFCRTMGCTSTTEITRIEWRYLVDVGEAS